jgi:hypothetical protein
VLLLLLLLCPGGYFVAIMLVFLGSLVGLKLPGLFSGGPLSICVHMVAAGLAAANLLVRGSAGAYACQSAQALRYMRAVWTACLRCQLGCAGGRLAMLACQPHAC